MVVLLSVRDRREYQKRYYSKIIESNKDRVFDEDAKRECNLCHRLLPATPEYFYKSKYSKNGLVWRCKECRKKTHDKNSHLKTRYNLTKDEYNELEKSQNGVCVVCGKEELCVDHNHESGEVRGLLCNRCNSAVGFVEALLKENLLDKAIKYLKGDKH